MRQYAIMEVKKIRNFLVKSYLRKQKIWELDMLIDSVWVNDLSQATLFDSLAEPQALVAEMEAGGFAPRCLRILTFENGREIAADRPFGITNLASGSQGNATVIHGPDGNFLVDCGLSCKETMTRLQMAGIAPESIRAILITHDHHDHTCGAGIFARKMHIPVYMTVFVHKRRVDPAKPGRFVCRTFAPASVFMLCGVMVEPFLLAHDASQTVGYLFHCGGKKIGIATDLGVLTEPIRKQLCGCSILMLEANHDPAMLKASKRFPEVIRRIGGKRGHLSNDTVAVNLPALLTPATRTLMLAHLSCDCNTPELVMQTMTARLREMGRSDVQCVTASQAVPSATYFA